MKRIITILIIFCAFQSQAQTWTTKVLSEKVRDLASRLDMKDTKDSIRNVKLDSLRLRSDLLFWENKQLKTRLDSAGAYLSGEYYDFDSVTKVYTPKPDTVIIYRPKVDKSSLQMRGMAASNTQPLLTLQQKNQEVDNLKWQIKQYENLLDDDKKVIDKLQKKIKAQQKVIDKLKH